MGLRGRLAAAFYRPDRISTVEFPPHGTLRFATHALPDRWISEGLRRGDIFEQHITDLLAAGLRAGDLFVDAGGNIGWFAVVGSKLVGPSGRVLTFEPDPFNVRLLRRNLRLNKCRNVTLHPVALSDRTGRIPHGDARTAAGTQPGGICCG